MCAYISKDFYRSNLTYANARRSDSGNNAVPITGAVLGVAGIGAGVLLGLKGMQVTSESEIAPVLDTAEAAGALQGQMPQQKDNRREYASEIEVKS